MKLFNVVYKGIECKIIFDYTNGNYEILCLGEVFLGNEKKLEVLGSNKEKKGYP